MKKGSCKIKVEIPKNADKQKVESAVTEALKAKLTDAKVSECKQITILVTRHPEP
jgi:hypothetical protein